MTKISIITVNFNNQAGLLATIKSVSAQTSKNFEYIIVDGGSGDADQKILNENKADIDILISEPDSGIYNAMNKGIKIAKGEYLLFLNSGDVLHNASVIERVSNAVSESIDLYYGDIIYKMTNQPDKTVYFPKNLNFNYFYKYNISHQASFIKRDLFYNIGFYNESKKIVSDWEFFMVALFKHQINYLHLNFIICDYDGNGLSSNLENHPEMFDERESTIKTYFPGFIEDYKLLNKFSDKNLSFLLQLKEPNKFAWGIVKVMTKIIKLFVSKKKG